MVLIGLIGAKQRHPSNAGLNVQVFFAVADARDKLETGSAPITHLDQLLAPDPKCARGLGEFIRIAAQHSWKH